MEFAVGAPKKQSPASQVMEELSRLATRANDLSCRVEETFAAVTFPSTPILASNIKCPDAPREMYPPYFEEIDSRLSDLSRNLDRIEAIVNRCGL